MATNGPTENSASEVAVMAGAGGSCCGSRSRTVLASKRPRNTDPEVSCGGADPRATLEDDHGGTRVQPPRHPSALAPRQPLPHLARRGRPHAGHCRMGVSSEGLPATYRWSNSMTRGGASFRGLESTSNPAHRRRCVGVGAHEEADAARVVRVLGVVRCRVSGSRVRSNE